MIQSVLNCTDYALAGLTESGSAENKNINTSEARGTSTKKRVNGASNGVESRINGVNVTVNGVDKVVNGIQNGVHGVANGNAKFVERNSIKSNSQERDNPTKTLNDSS